MRIVIALGGNALGKTPEEQLQLVKKTAHQIVKIVKDGHEVVIVHGNGPQVGMINLAFDNAYQNKIGTPLMPFAECGAMSQGYIGYHLQQAISEELKQEGISKECATIITQVEVDSQDKAFENPTKPVGMFYSQKQAEEIKKEKGYIFVEDAGRGYRRVVPSPKPVRILEQEVVEELIHDGNVVITCGGGGIPVIKENDSYKGVDAVIDKDFAAASLATSIKADVLLILTSVSKISIKYNTPSEKKLNLIDLDMANKYIKAGEFAEGSMLPKVQACTEFVENNPQGVAIVASLSEGLAALNGKTGTRIIYNKEEKQEMSKETKKKNKKTMLSAFSIIFIMIFILAIASHLLPQAQFVDDEIVNGSGVVGAKLSDVLMSPILGFQDAMDVCVFIMILGAYLAVVTKTGALETGIKVLINKLKGKELILIPILMFIFSIGGTTYGMLEETVGFYALLSATMVAAGMDTIVASATILLGAGVGVLGSTINPFAVGAAIDALPEGIAINQGVVIALGMALWIASYIIAVLYVMKYAKKVKKDKGSTFLSLQEQKNMEKRYGEEEIEEDIKLTSKQKITLWIFGLSFVIMILGFIPWGDFGVTFFDNISGFLVGTPLGTWYFNEASLWFLIITILLCIINGFSEKETVDTFVDGADDMVGVMLIIAVARGVSVLMGITHFDNYIIYNAAEFLKGMPAILYAPCNYLLHIVLSVLVPSSSGIASLSTPIMGPLTAQLGFSVETNIMILVAANGLVNLITPTCGAIMGGLAVARVEYSTWFKWAFKLILYLALVSIFILTLGMVLF